MQSNATPMPETASSPSHSVGHGPSAGQSPRLRSNCLFAVAILVASAALSCWGSAEDPFVPDGDAPPAAWGTYGGDPGGQRYSALQEIAPHNVHRLAVAWEYRTGDLSDGQGDIPSTSAFQATPILVDQTLYLCSPFNRVIALEPETGEERWIYDPGIDLSVLYANQLVCRGVAAWLDPSRRRGMPPSDFHRDE